jgi:multiple sugar transport system permease protein
MLGSKGGEGDEMRAPVTERGVERSAGYRAWAGGEAALRRGRPAPRRWWLRKRALVPALFVAPSVVYAVLFFAYPLAYGIIMSFERFDFQAVVHGSGPLVGLTNYRQAIADPVTLTAVRNTVIFTVASVVSQVVIGLGIAVLLNRSFFLAPLLRRLVLVPWLIPLVASGTVFSLLFGSENGFINNLLQQLHLISSPVQWLISTGPALAALILVNIWAGIPFNVIVLYSGLQDIDPVLNEAATVDGTTAFQRLRYVTLPLLRPVLLIVVMLGIIGTVKAFDIVWVMTAGGPNNATQLMSTWAYTQAFSSFNFGEGAAISNLLLVASFLMALVYLRSLRRRPGV